MLRLFRKDLRLVELRNEAWHRFIANEQNAPLLLGYHRVLVFVIQLGEITRSISAYTIAVAAAQNEDQLLSLMSMLRKFVAGFELNQSEIAFRLASNWNREVPYSRCQLLPRQRVQVAANDLN
jgi:hypothetical protein